LSFTDVDTTNTHTVSVSNNADAVWSGGALSPAQIGALTSGFTADGDSWDYAVSNAATQFLAAGETVTFSYDVTVTDNDGG
ncbi:VCBS domain-containing protein, partial [Aeromonas sp. MR16]|uniref:VCBS domain-containing protein n=1 Tax=Aeromonas sp. MR16 TaxID=2923420 RepID=UPI001F4A14AE